MRHSCPQCGQPLPGPRLSLGEIAVANSLTHNLGHTDEEIGALVGLNPRTVKMHLQRLYARFGIDPDKERRVVLAYWWTCELFQQGLRELGMIAEQKVLA